MATTGRGSRDIALQLEARPAAAREARRALRGAGLSTDVEQRVALLATEVVGNAVRHARLRPGERIELVARLGRDHARVEVSDAGDCFEPASVGRAGYGLRLMELLATRWGVERDGRCRVWFEVTTGPSRPRP